MGYADLTSASAQLNIDPNASADADAVALLAECDDTVSRLFEIKAGFDAAQSPIWRGVGAVVPDTTKTVWGEVGYGDVLNLAIPATSITSIAHAGAAPLALTAAQWMPWNASDLGAIRSIRRLGGGYWPIRAEETWVTVTGQWADGPQAADPPEVVVNACTFLAVEDYRMRTMSPAGEIGPEGFSIRPRNPWNFEIVKGALDAVRVAIPAAVF
jgi:hypothetical protein